MRRKLLLHVRMEVDEIAYQIRESRQCLERSAETIRRTEREIDRAIELRASLLAMSEIFPASRKRSTDEER